MVCHGEDEEGCDGGSGGGRGKRHHPLPLHSLPCTLSGGDVSIRMVWLRALGAITAMSCCAPSTSGYQTGYCAAWRGLSPRFVLGKRNKKGARRKESEKKAAEKVPSHSGHLSLNAENVKDGKKKGADWGKDEKVQVILSNFPCL